MSEADEYLKPYIFAACIFLVILYVFYLFWGKYGERIHKKVYAIIMNKIAKSYNKWMDKRKTKLFAPLHDLAVKGKRPLTVLEVGAGPGANFKYYPDDTRVICVDPNPAFESYLDENGHEFPYVTILKFIQGAGEYMPEIGDASVDAVVSTLVMCSVQDVSLCMREIKRVLKPGCSFFFLDHVRGDANSWTYFIQRIIEPIWRRIADNCHVTRQPWKNMEAEGFIVDYELFTGVRGNRFLLAPWKPHCIGVATKSEG